MGRSSCCSREGLNRGTWSEIEDKVLTSYVKAHGEGKWRSLPERAGLKRCGKSCRLRWLNYLKPGIKRGNISPDEEELIIRLHKLLGSRWSLIAGRLPGRTDNEIKNYWKTILAKKVGAQYSSKPSKQGLMTRNSRAKTTKPPISPLAAIRPKALRCTNVLVPAMALPSHRLSVNSTAQNVLDLQAYIINPLVECATQEFHMADFHGLDSLRFDCDELGKWDPNRACSYSFDDLFFCSDHPLPAYETIVNDWIWTPNYF